MTANAAHADPDVISKAEFARRREVSPGRVSQWIAAGQISGAAIVGEGRNAKIRESVAVEQLLKRLDPMQMTANGLTTNLKPAVVVAGAVLSFDRPPAADGATPLPTDPPPPDDRLDNSIEAQIKRGRLEQIERDNRKGQREEALAAGKLTDGTLASQAAAREAARLITDFEGYLSGFATSISAEFKLPQRDVLHLLRGDFRKFRAEAAGRVRATVAALPLLVEFDVAAETQDQLEPEDA